MKRSPLKRKTPLRARNTLRARRGATKHARRERAPSEWFAFVKGLPCFVRVLAELGQWEGKLTPCGGSIDADHMGDRFRDGDGTRARDSTCVPMCHDHHMERHGLAGSFRDFTRDDMRALRSTGVQWTQKRAQLAGVSIPDC